MDIYTYDIGKHLPSIRERFAAGSAEIRISGFSGNFGSVGRSLFTASKITIVVQKNYTCLEEVLRGLPSAFSGSTSSCGGFCSSEISICGILLSSKF